MLKYFIFKFKEAITKQNYYTLLKGCLCKCNWRFFVQCCPLSTIFIYSIYSNTIHFYRFETKINYFPQHLKLWGTFVYKVEKERDWISFGLFFYIMNTICDWLLKLFKKCWSLQIIVIDCFSFQTGGKVS